MRDTLKIPDAEIVRAGDLLLYAHRIRPGLIVLRNLADEPRGLISPAGAGMFRLSVDADYQLLTLIAASPEHCISAFNKAADSNRWPITPPRSEQMRLRNQMYDCITTTTTERKTQ